MRAPHSQDSAWGTELNHLLSCFWKTSEFSSEATWGVVMRKPFTIDYDTDYDSGPSIDSSHFEHGNWPTST